MRWALFVLWLWCVWLRDWTHLPLPTERVYHAYKAQPVEWVDPYIGVLFLIPLKYLGKGPIGGRIGNFVELLLSATNFKGRSRLLVALQTLAASHWVWAECLQAVFPIGEPVSPCELTIAR